jgi:choline dehydrogenase-like flavoprotein
VHPEVDPRYLTHEADLDVLAYGMKFLDKLAHAPALEGKLAKRLHPSPQRDLAKHEDRREAVLDFYIGEYHVCGSVAMGDALDSKLIVKGTQNIRVVDASIFPGNVSGNIMSSVYMLAERAADIIKEDWITAPLKNLAVN